MEASTLFWHVADFAIVPVATGVVATALAWLVWRRPLRGRFVRVATAAAAAMLVVSFLGLVVFERDGQMATYAAMLVGGAGAIGWFGLRGRG